MIGDVVIPSFWAGAFTGFASGLLLWLVVLMVWGAALTSMAKQQRGVPVEDLEDELSTHRFNKGQ